MTKGESNQGLDIVVALLSHYRFDCAGQTPEDLAVDWCVDYQINWVKLAIIEALYQGRYKSCSVEQILNSWQRRGQSTHHFNSEFENLIYSRLPLYQHPAAIAELTIDLEDLDLFGEIGNLVVQIPKPKRINWSRCELGKQPIDKFTPQAQVGDFYRKLKTVATLAGD
jgi:hypothetical protein